MWPTVLKDGRLNKYQSQTEDIRFLGDSDIIQSLSNEYHASINIILPISTKELKEMISFTLSPAGLIGIIQRTLTKPTIYFNDNTE